MVVVLLSYRERIFASYRVRIARWLLPHGWRVAVVPMTDPYQPPLRGYTKDDLRRDTVTPASQARSVERSGMRWL